VGGQTVECETHPFGSWTADIQWLFRKLFLHVSAARIKSARDDDDRKQAQNNHCNQQDVSLHLKFRRLKIKVAAANNTALYKTAYATARNMEFGSGTTPCAAAVITL